MKQIDSITTQIKRSERVIRLVKELDNTLKQGTIEHFIEWHNSKVTKNFILSEKWVAEYFKEIENE